MKKRINKKRTLPKHDNVSNKIIPTNESEFYLSFDPASKSLAIGLYEIKTNWRKELLDMNIDNLITIHYLNVIDIIPNKQSKNVDIVERSEKLKLCLCEVNKKLNDILLLFNKNNNKINVCVEYQMSQNHKSRIIYHQLIYEYSDSTKFNVIPIIPTLKNQLYLSNELKYSTFIRKYATNYTANKSHTKHNFLFYLKTMNLNNKIDKIKKKNLDDIADTFMQCLAYHLINVVNVD